MTTLYECDWCGSTFRSREYVASADVTIGQSAENLHMCAGCAPDFLKQEYPE